MFRAAALFLIAILSTVTASAAEITLFDFEEPADIKPWSNFRLPDASEQEPEIAIERVAEHATSGKHSLKLTFAGGRWPTLTNGEVPDDWSAYHTLKADVAVSRPCLVGLAVYQEKSGRDGGWEGVISRWVKTVFAQPGRNEISAVLRPHDYAALNPKFGKVVRFEIFLYSPLKGESIFVDNIRLTSAKDDTPPPAKTNFRVAGTDWTVGGVKELGKQLKDQWQKPTPQTVAEVEARFQALHKELSAKHPRAVLAVLRDGEKGFDPARPEQIYAGWKDAYWSSHGPDGMTVERAHNLGESAGHEIFMRHRSPLMRVDLSFIPTGANILAAELLVVRDNPNYDQGRNPEVDPNMWVVEPCNRPWVENEVNAYEYARNRFWKEIGGVHYRDDPDFLPLFLAYGPGHGKVNTWDFREAVKFWTDGKQPNHGFMLHGDSFDWMIRAHAREARELKDRPAVLVIYEPK